MESSNKVSLKILIDRRGERVLFAEAGKDFVDFLSQIFSLPLGSVVSFLSKERMVGCLGKLYSNIEKLNNTCIQPCASKINDLLTYLQTANGKAATQTDEGCYGKGLVTYMIMDDLEVKPISTISSIALLNKFDVKCLGDLEEKDVYFGMDEALKLLKASLQSDAVLTSVFLAGNNVTIE